MVSFDCELNTVAWDCLRLVAAPSRTFLKKLLSCIAKRELQLSYTNTIAIKIFTLRLINILDC